MKLACATRLLSAAVVLALPAASAWAQVTLVQEGGHPQLRVDAEPFAIKGAGGDGDKALLAASGGNAFRTWGVDEKTKPRLDEAQKHGLKVVIGIWMGHERHGFDYDDPAQVQKQFDDAKAAVETYKDHPALLMWGVGNEMEEYAATTNPKVWKAVNKVAAMIKAVDGDHPTMTVTAEIGGDRLKSIEKFCPDIDIVGINTYGGVTSIPQRYAAEGISKPYIVTEFGPPGTWEIGKNGWDVPEELTSTAKADVYKQAYAALDADPRCLGTFAFTWGFKQEATATWFGMFLPDGSKLGAVDAMAEAWSGKKPANLCPVVKELSIVGAAQAPAGTAVRAELEVTDPEGDPLTVEWVLFQEQEVFESQGDFRPTPPTFPDAIGEASQAGVTVTMPKRPGNYRLFAYIRDGAGGAAVANKPLQVQGDLGDTPYGLPTQLPLLVYSDAAQGSAFVPSGYMGETASIVMNEKFKTQPQSGATCLEVLYNKSDGWGGVVWQSPANDWGDKRGGFDLSSAGTLSFWARGDQGGESVKFGFGLIGREKPFYDTAKAEKQVRLTTDWQQFQIPLTGRNMACIKSGFFWTVAGSGAPIRFYLDDIVYTDEGGGGAEGGVAPPLEAAQLPVKLLGDGIGELPWIPSGFMGEAAAITMDAVSKDQPHSGATATKVTYANPGAWGGVVWQHPVNDWGDKPGGHNLTGATELTFWARGDKGGETVKFGFGLLGADATYADTDKGEIEVTLTQDWTAYTIDVAGKDLSQIKTGFYWTLAGQGAPVTFYLDDIAYTGGVVEPQ